jgi:hypothetical protein
MNLKAILKFKMEKQKLNEVDYELKAETKNFISHF